MAVTAAMVKELREMTGAGMMDCKKALAETNGSIDEAVKFLREKGLAAAAKKDGRIASEGLTHIVIAEDNSTAAIVEVNSETDFVAKNSEFQTFVNDVAKHILASNAADVEALLDEAWTATEEATVRDALTQKIAVIGEKLTIRRFAKLTKEGAGALVSYIHGGGSVSVLVELSGADANDAIVKAGRNIGMQIASMRPQFVSSDEVSAEFIQNEKEILTQQALNEGKPANIVEKMIEGRMKKYLKEICLVDQEYVQDGELSVAQYLEAVSKEVGAKLSVKRFVCYKTGEGIEKKEENFAEEVSKAMQG